MRKPCAHCSLLHMNNTDGVIKLSVFDSINSTRHTRPIYNGAYDFYKNNQQIDFSIGFFNFTSQYDMDTCSVWTYRLQKNLARNPQLVDEVWKEKSLMGQSIVKNKFDHPIDPFGFIEEMDDCQQKMASRTFNLDTMPGELLEMYGKAKVIKERIENPQSRDNTERLKIIYNREVYKVEHKGEVIETNGYNQRKLLKVKLLDWGAKLLTENSIEQLALLRFVNQVSRKNSW